MQTGTLPPVSNKADWIEEYELYDDETDETLDISTAEEITVSIRDPKTESVELTASLSGGAITHIETGVFEFVFTVAQMRGLCPKIYDVGMTILKDDITTQILIGYLPVSDGIVS